MTRRPRATRCVFSSEWSGGRAPQQLRPCGRSFPNILQKGLTKLLSLKQKFAGVFQQIQGLVDPSGAGLPKEEEVLSPSMPPHPHVRTLTRMPCRAAGYLPRRAAQARHRHCARAVQGSGVHAASDADGRVMVAARFGRTRPRSSACASPSSFRSLRRSGWCRSSASSRSTRTTLWSTKCSCRTRVRPQAAERVLRTNMCNAARRLDVQEVRGPRAHAKEVPGADWRLGAFLLARARARQRLAFVCVDLAGKCVSTRTLT